MNAYKILDQINDIEQRLKHGEPSKLHEAILKEKLELLNELIKIQSELDAYKIALNYFVKEGGKPAFDIAQNLLKEVKK